jgi:hypothetical protein
MYQNVLVPLIGPKRKPHLLLVQYTPNGDEDIIGDCTIICPGNSELDSGLLSQFLTALRPLIGKVYDKQSKSLDMQLVKTSSSGNDNSRFTFTHCAFPRWIRDANTPHNIWVTAALNLLSLHDFSTNASGPWETEDVIFRNPSFSNMTIDDSMRNFVVGAQTKLIEDLVQNNQIGDLYNWFAQTRGVDEYNKLFTMYTLANQFTGKTP